MYESFLYIDHHYLALSNIQQNETSSGANYVNMYVYLVLLVKYFSGTKHIVWSHSQLVGIFLN